MRQLSKTEDLPKSCHDHKVLPPPHHRTAATNSLSKQQIPGREVFRGTPNQKPIGRKKPKPHSWCALALKGGTVPSITLQQQGAQLQTRYFRVTASCSPGKRGNQHCWEEPAPGTFCPRACEAQGKALQQNHPAKSHPRQRRRLNARPAIQIAPLPEADTR